MVDDGLEIYVDDVGRIYADGETGHPPPRDGGIEYLAGDFDRALHVLFEKPLVTEPWPDTGKRGMRYYDWGTVHCSLAEKSEFYRYIDSVPWAEVEHAYGVASDAPRELRRLVSNYFHDRTDAIAGFLCSSANHQYTIYSATPWVMLCVLRALKLEGLADRPAFGDDVMAYSLLQFVRVCAESGQQGIYGTPHPKSPTIEEAAAAGIELYHGFPNHPEPKVRAEAETLLKLVSEQSKGGTRPEP